MTMLTITKLGTAEICHYFYGKPFSENQNKQLVEIGCEVEYSPSVVSTNKYTGMSFIQPEFTIVKTTTEKHEVILRMIANE